MATSTDFLSGRTDGLSDYGMHKRPESLIMLAFLSQMVEDVQQLESM